MEVFVPRGCAVEVDDEDEDIEKRWKMIETL
jgi:hypothetical protein